MRNVSSLDLARRFERNPLLKPGDVKPSVKAMRVECLLNPGVFRYNEKIWLLIRVAECPVQVEGYVSLPVYSETGEIEILQFSKNDPQLDFTDPRVIRYQDRDYLTTLSHLRLMCSDDGKTFYDPEGYNTI